MQFITIILKFLRKISTICLLTKNNFFICLKVNLFCDANSKIVVYSFVINL